MERGGDGTIKGIGESGREGARKMNSVCSTLVFVLTSYAVSTDL